MDNAKLVEYNLDITFGCPKCDYLFQLSNYSIPTEGSTYQVCENCQIALEVKPISINIDFTDFTKPIKLKKDKKKEVPVNKLLEDAKNIIKTKDKKKEVPVNKLLEDAKRIIQTYGFSMKEIDNVLDTLGTNEMSIETIVKEILSRIDNKHESIKT